MSPNVITCAELPAKALQQLLRAYDLEVIEVSETDTLPGSFWGDPEAGLIGNRLYVRPATPVHLHGRGTTPSTAYGCRWRV